MSPAAFPCGRLPGGLDATLMACRHGNCPWQVRGSRPIRTRHELIFGSIQRRLFVVLAQVTLLSSRGAELCDGVVLGRRSVLTAASCLQTDPNSALRPSDFSVVAGMKFVTYFVTNMSTGEI